MEKQNKKSGRKSIRTKLLYLPVILVIVSIIGIIVSVSFKTDSSMKRLMQDETEFLLANVVERFKDNNDSIDSMDRMVDNSIIGSLEVLKNTNNEMTNESINQIANHMQLYELNLYNSDGVITHSNLPENIGYVSDGDHSVKKLQNSSEELVVEEIRESTLADVNNKFGAIKNSDGTVFQVGVDASELIQMTSRFEHQKIIDDMVSTEDVMYASYINENFIPEASSDESYIGNDVSSEEEVIRSIEGGEIISTVMEFGEEEVFDVIHPVIVDGQNLGALRIGFYLDHVNDGIKENIISVTIGGLIVILLLGFVLYRSSKEIIDIITDQKLDTELMAEGDFSRGVPEEILNREDEFGEIARANMRMKESIREILGNVRERAEVVASYSQELTATTEESERFARELSQVIDDVAEAATSQAHDVESGAIAVRELDSAINVNFENMGRLNNAAESVNVLKDEGLELIKDLVDKTDETGVSVREIATIIEETNTSADNIVRAIEMISSIAEQTNLLALNASIEAARAGESGRGFTVVAEEIRDLAEESSRFTEEIDLIVRDLTNKTSRAVGTMANLEEIVEYQESSVDRTDGKFQGISTSIEEIDNIIEEVNNSNRSINEQEKNLSHIIENLAALAEENAAGTEEAAASVDEQNTVMAQINEASEQLAVIAEELNEATSIFRI